MKKNSETPTNSKNAAGFSLVELMIAVFILAFGLLATAQLLTVTMKLDAMSRLKSASATAAQSKLDNLTDLYRRNPAAEELTIGAHQADGLMEILNPATQKVLNRYKITWVVDNIPDPRSGVDLPGRIISVRATPMLSESEENTHPFYNKAASFNAVISGAPQ